MELRLFLGKMLHTSQLKWSVLLPQQMKSNPAVFKGRGLPGVMWPLWTRPRLLSPASCQQWNQPEQETSLPCHMITSADSPTGSSSACCRHHKTNFAVSSGVMVPTINHLTSCDCKPPITETQPEIVKCVRVWKTRANQLSVTGWKLYHFPGFYSDRLICLQTPFIDLPSASRKGR